MKYASHWKEVFSKSSLGENIYFFKNCFEDDIRKVMKHWEIRPHIWGSGSAINAYTDEHYYSLLDGGYVYINGNYFIGLRGNWIIGTKALRFLIAELELDPPKRKLKNETCLANSESIAAELQTQIKNHFGELVANQMALMEIFEKIRSR